MTDYIIILIILIVLGLGIKETIKHFKGESGCCGGPAMKIKPKKLKNSIIHIYYFEVGGMHCQNCVNNVMNAINDIPGASAEVNLKSKTAKVYCDREVDTDTIIKAVTKKGYGIRVRK